MFLLFFNFLSTLSDPPPQGPPFEVSGRLGQAKVGDFDVGVGSLAGSSKFILASEDGSLKFWDANVGRLFTQVG